ncbi:MAG: peptidase M15 [Ruminococcaceae bacterium]|nr:peptidase M15 [Oscillospiraceae bacterium]
MLFATSVLPTSAASSFADADNDGRILSADARIVLRASVGLSPWTDEMLKNCDIDNDKTLTSGDARLILRLSVGFGNEDDSCLNGMEGAELVGLTAKDYKIYEKDGITYIDGILIANKTYPLPSTYNPGALLPECKQAFNQMAYDAYYGDGIYLYELSGYRSYATQNRLYNNYVAADGKQLADTYSARPGHSEHQSGLALDVNSVEASFAYTAEAKWLAANCYKYGFILRYPYGKTNKTGYIYEAWHIRYVGVDIATKIHNSGLCLEEYYGITSKYNY